MSGTSMDGIDISLVKTNGKKIIRLNKNYFFEYNKKTKDFLLKILEKDLKSKLTKKLILDNIITNLHYKALIRLNILKDCDLIAFHGQTIYHNPNFKTSIQLGNPQKLANLLKKDVVSDFRVKDIKLGGEGAPLAPIYHKIIIEELNLSLPSSILNIGGVSNLTFWDGTELIGFDIGPGNALMNDFMKKKFNKYFDENGDEAKKGNPNREILVKFLQNDFFYKRPPKSLDRNTFKNLYLHLLEKNLSPNDTMATLNEFTVESIIKGFEFLPKKSKNVIVTGGGYKNNYLISRLKERLRMVFIEEKDLNINFDFIEAELMALLAARSIYNLPYTFPTTTGILNASSGGRRYNYL